MRHVRRVGPDPQVVALAARLDAVEAALDRSVERLEVLIREPLADLTTRLAALEARLAAVERSDST